MSDITPKDFLITFCEFLISKPRRKSVVSKPCRNYIHALIEVKQVDIQYLKPGTANILPCSTMMQCYSHLINIPQMNLVCDTRKATVEAILKQLEYVTKGLITMQTIIIVLNLKQLYSLVPLAL